MAERTSVVVTWANPVAPNLGVRALAEGTAALLEASLGAQPEISFPVFEDEPLRSTLSTRALALGLLTSAGDLRDYVGQFDVLVEAGGGDSFTDIYGLPRLARMAHIHRAARSAGVPVVFGPQTIGPFGTRAGRYLARGMLRSARVVLARDSISAEHSRQLGRDPDALATDVVFALPQPPIERGRDVVLNVSGLLWETNPHVDASAYRKAVRIFISGALGAGRAVTLLPHVLDNPSPDNDVPVAQHLADEYGDAVELRIPESLHDARSVLGSAAVVVGARMHACLNALSSGVAAFPWAYSRKFLPLMNDLDWSAGVDLRSAADPAGETLRYIQDGPSRANATPLEVRARAEARLQRAVDALRTGLGDSVR